MNHIGRKLYHLIGGIGLLSLYYLLERKEALICYSVIFLSVLAIDVTRLRNDAFNRFMQTRFSSFIRKNEANTLTGTAPYVLGIGLTLYLYQTGTATAAILFLACGDVMATAVGERFGRTKVAREKSLEGTAAFFVTAVLSGVFLNITAFQMSFGIMFIGAFVAALVELLPLPVNDNLSIPVVSGGAMELLARTLESL